MTQQIQQIADHVGNLLGIGFKGEQLAEKAYEFALALQEDQLREGEKLSAANMAMAAYFAKSAMPEAYRLHELNQRIR